MSDRYDWGHIRAARRHGASWKSLADEYDVTPGTIRKAWTRYKRRVEDRTGATFTPDPEPQNGDGENDPQVLLTEDDVRRITSLEDLVEFFEVDTERWQVDTFRVNKWENFSVAEGVTPLYQVRANLVRNRERDAEIARQIYEQALADLRAAPSVPDHEIGDFNLSRAVAAGLAGDEPCMGEIALMDPHVGMLAWGDETGGPSYDLSIATCDYRTVGHGLVDMLATMHPTLERALLVIGNDTVHADKYGEGGKGATTARGTQQDIDTRLPKIATAVRRAVVDLIDYARTTLAADVDVMVVPGNHDPMAMYHLGEVLNAWYRDTRGVQILYGPAKRSYYQYGENGFMFTHGEEFKRKREPLPLIFATESPDIWAASKYREVHCGHWHATAEREYMAPSDVLTETRSIRTRVLPGLTPADAWHATEGYEHHRAGTALVFKRSGGLVSLHEVQP